MFVTTGVSAENHTTIYFNNFAAKHLRSTWEIHSAWPLTPPHPPPWFTPQLKPNRPGPGPGCWRSLGVIDVVSGLTCPTQFVKWSQHFLLSTHSIMDARTISSIIQLTLHKWFCLSHVIGPESAEIARCECCYLGSHFLLGSMLWGALRKNQLINTYRADNKPNTGLIINPIINTVVIW